MRMSRVTPLHWRDYGMYHCPVAADGEQFSPSGLEKLMTNRLSLNTHTAADVREGNITLPQGGALEQGPFYLQTDSGRSKGIVVFIFHWEYNCCCNYFNVYKVYNQWRNTTQAIIIMLSLCIIFLRYGKSVVQFC